MNDHGANPTILPAYPSSEMEMPIIEHWKRIRGEREMIMKNEKKKTVKGQFFSQTVGCSNPTLVNGLVIGSI